MFQVSSVLADIFLIFLELALLFRRLASRLLGCCSVWLMVQGTVLSELIVKFFHGDFTPQGFKRYSGLWKGPPPGNIGKKASRQTRETRETTEMRQSWLRLDTLKSCHQFHGQFLHVRDIATARMFSAGHCHRC